MRPNQNRNYRNAILAYSDAFAAAASCVTYSRVSLPGRDRRRSDDAYTLALSNMEPAPCNGSTGLWLRAIVGFNVEPLDTLSKSRFRIIETSYYYDISTGPASDDEVIGFHWDRETVNAPSYPHLHVGSWFKPKSPQASALTDFHRLHIPTGHVTFPMVVRFLIEELGVTPINPRWESILSETGPA